jgi:hypothetical protein
MASLCKAAGYEATGGQKKVSGTFSSAVTSLRASGYLAPGSPLELTREGRAALGEVPALPAGDLFIATVRARLGTMAGAVLREVLDPDPPADTVTLAKRAGYVTNSGGEKKVSGTFSGTLTKLRLLGWMSSRGVRATEEARRAYWGDHQ